MLERRQNFDGEVILRRRVNCYGLTETLKAACKMKWTVLFDSTRIQ